MLLSDGTIISNVESGHLTIVPWDIDLVQPASLDVRLSSSFIWSSEAQRKGFEQEGVVRLHRGEFLLGATEEWFAIPNDMAARFEGKSSLGRLGLLTHITAGFIDPGFQGNITVELVNVGNKPLDLTPGMLIGQMCFLTLDAPALAPYGTQGVNSHYQGQEGATASTLEI